MVWVSTFVFIEKNVAARKFISELWSCWQADLLNLERGFSVVLAAFCTAKCKCSDSHLVFNGILQC